MATLVATPEAAKPKALTVFRVTSGNFLEMFDFFLFAFYATYISKTFFPSRQRVRLADGDLHDLRGGLRDAAPRRDFPRRLYRPHRAPQGAHRHAFDHGGRHGPHRFRAGLRSDRRARRPSSWCSAGSIQGFSAGVELGGVSVYLAEMATPGHKGFYVSWQSASQQIATVVAALIGFILGKTPVARADGGLGLAHPLRHRLPDHPVHLRHPPFAAGDGGVPCPQAASEPRRGLRVARGQLARSCSPA